MDKPKLGPGRGGKTKTPQFPSDLYILGPKGARTEGNETRRPVPVPVPVPVAAKSAPSHPLADRRRLPTNAAGPSSVPSSTVPPSKKPKLTSSVLSRPSPFLPPTGPQEPGKSWEHVAIDVEPIDLVPTVIEAKENGENEKITALLCGALRLLKVSKMKTDTTLMNGLLLLAKKYPTIFTKETVMTALCSLLRREYNAMYKGKTSYANAVLLVNIIFYAYQNVDQWPDILLKMYIDDSLGERLWVDSEHCKCFIDNIICSVNTTPAHNFDLESGARIDSEGGIMDIIGEEHKPYLVINRYKGVEEVVENIVMDAAKDQLNRRQATEGISKHFLKFLCSMCGITEVRALVASKLEVWLTNPKLKNNAKELLMTVCVNCTSNAPRDVDIVASIVKIKLKVKDLHGFYLACIRELIPAHDNNLATVLHQIVNNELVAARNQNYVPMLMFSTLYQADPEQFASILAKIFLEHLFVREDNLRALRSILREISKVLRTDFDLIGFVRGLLKQSEPLPADIEIKEHVFRCISDLVSVCVFLAVSLYARTERRDLSQVEKTQMVIANIQCYAIKRFYKNAFQAFRPPEKDFKPSIRKVVFLEPHERYYEPDNWPSEQDRGLYLRLSIDVPLLQKTIMYLLRLGLSKEHPLTCVEALEIVEQLVIRASSLAFSLTIPVLPAEDLEMVDLMFNICTYRQPESTELPPGYVPPNLAVSSLYWKVWIILLIYCAHAPHVFGLLAWEKYPTLRVLIEMCITNNFVFPVMPADELQISALEKQKILEYETHLAKGTITESNSFLLSLVVTMDPFGSPRRPSLSVLDQLQQLNATHKLGQLLCRSRNPDFLLDIIRKQGSSQSMPWLADLVQNSESSFDHLPVQCLCEFLLSTSDRQGRYQQLLQHLQNLLTDGARDPNVACEILDHFLRRFSSHSNKEQAIYGLKLLLSPNEEEMEVDNQETNHGDVSTWILNKLPSIPHFALARPQIVKALREACQVENDPELITSYLTFLSQHVLPSNTDLQEMTELVLDMAQLIVERSTIMAAVLPTPDDDESIPNIALTALLKIFYTYLMKAREARAEEYTWPESQEQILVTWPSGERATLYILVVHAIIILLTYERKRTDRVYLYWDSLLNMWFPEQKELTPKAFLVDTKEEALLIPDWLKLRMIRSEVPRLIEEALTDLEPAQLLLFIQSFGIPVKSMSILLQTLDIAISTKRISIPDVAIDKTYMIQLVEVQHNRKATGGTLFANTIRGLDMEITIPDSPSAPSTSLQLPKQEPLDDEQILPTSSRTSIPDVELDQIIEHMKGGGKPSASPKFIDEIQQKLLHVVSSELRRSPELPTKCSTTIVKKMINKLLRKCSADPKFVSELIRNFRYPCNLFRLLTTTKAKEHVGPLAVIAKTILECKAASEKPKNPLVVILKTFLNRNDYSEITAKLTRPDPDAKNVLIAFENCSIDQLEQTGTNLMESAMRKTHGAKTVIEAVSGLITRSDKKFENASGLFIDWLVQIEPEILGSSMDLQMNMLFSPKKDTRWESLQVCRPYLLTLLTHHASWYTLEKALSKLLTLDATKKYDATAVLEFLWAVARNPRLWQGRELITPKHQQPKDILDLTESELICVIEYIVLETESIGFNERGLSRMSHRLSQLVECSIEAKNTRILVTIIEHLSKETNSSLRSQICKNVIAHLYLRIPRIVNLLDEIQINIEFDLISKAARDSSILDLMSHTVLTSFTMNSQMKESPKRTQELELILRKMSSTHPRLLLRQIKIIETALMGRIHLEWPVFRNRNYPTFFQQVFGLIELLQPHVFAVEFSNSFHSILDVYLNLFKAHGGWKDIDLLMPRYATLAHNYIGHDSKRAIFYFQSRSNLMKELATDFPCLGNLCVLMTGEQNSPEDKIVVPTSSVLEMDTSQWDDIINSFVKRDSEAALLGLDHASIRKPMLLEPLLERLFPFLLDDSSFNRSLAHMLLARCLKYNPQMASRVLPAVFDCLHSERPDVVKSACNHLPELIICCQEKAVPLLKKLFTLAIRNGINTVPCINKTISLINLQSGC